MKLTSIVALAVSGALLSAPSVAKEPKETKEQKLQRKLEAMTPEQFQQSAVIKDDAFETRATITTANGFQEKRGLLGIVPFDGMFRAFIDKKTGKTTYQVYITSFYYGEWAFWNMVNYQTADGPVSAELDVISRDVGSCSKFMGCSHTEIVAFDVPEAVLRANAAAYVPGTINPFAYKIKAKTGVERVDGFVGAEVKGLLMAVDAYKAAHNLS